MELLLIILPFVLCLAMPICLAWVTFIIARTIIRVADRSAGGKCVEKKDVHKHAEKWQLRMGIAFGVCLIGSSVMFLSCMQIAFHDFIVSLRYMLEWKFLILAYSLVGTVMLAFRSIYQYSFYRLAGAHVLAFALGIFIAMELALPENKGYMGAGLLEGVSAYFIGYAFLYALMQFLVDLRCAGMELLSLFGLRKGR